MRVGIDISQIAFPGTGVATYTKNLITNLPSGDYVFFGSSLRRQDLLRPYGRVFPLPPTLLEILWNQLHILPVESLIGKIDVFHSSDWTQPPTKAKKITTIHDLVVYRYPQWTHPRIVATQKRRLEWVKKECDLIIAVSQATKNDIIEFLKIPAERIKVIYEAASPVFRPIEEKTKPYVLGMGTPNSRKNIERLITAFNSLNLKDMELKIVGPTGLGLVFPEQLARLYAGAAVFVYPSLYEGFGLPVLEAFACGCPVITSDISSLPEVGGNAAVYVNPLNVDDIAEKIRFVLEGDRAKFAQKGLEQVKKFSWEKTARQTAEVYASL